MGETRKLAAILVSDVVGYSRLAGADEDRILARLRTLRSDLIDPIISVHHGRIVKRTGDGAIVEFRSVVDAVNCAIEVQRAMVERNAGVAPDKRIEFRIGIHLGDVVEESDGDLMGDGVNIAARLEGIAKPGAICLSEDAYRQVKGRLDLAVTDLGPTQLKNIAEPIRVYSLEVGKPAQAKPAPTPAPEKSAPPRLSMVVLPFANIGGDPEQEHFVDGVTESLTTDLSRIPGAVRHRPQHRLHLQGQGRSISSRSAASSTCATSSKAAFSAAETACGSMCSSSTPRPAVTSGPSGSTSRSPISSTCRTKSSRASPTGLGSETRPAEARRAERSANPDSMDHYFLGLALGSTRAIPPTILASARSHFDRALDLDPDNVDALVGSRAGGPDLCR